MNRLSHKQHEHRQCLNNFSGEYRSTEIYKESIKHLSGYEPLAKYVGSPIYVQWVKQVTYDKNTVTLVVPFGGPKGKALLIINGRKGPNNK